MAGSSDGYGQSLLDDVRSALRFRKCRARATVWSDDEAVYGAVLSAYPQIDRYADSVVGTAEVDGRTWIVLERLWHGWPDPPRFVFFALEKATIWAAVDFDHWPTAWGPPPP